MKVDVGGNRTVRIGSGANRAKFKPALSIRLDPPVEPRDMAGIVVIQARRVRLIGIENDTCGQSDAIRRKNLSFYDEPFARFGWPCNATRRADIGGSWRRRRRPVLASRHGDKKQWNDGEQSVDSNIHINL